MLSKPSRKWKRARCIEDWCVVPKDHVELAIIENEEPGCEANIGRLVAVVGEEVLDTDHQCWVPIRPMDSRPWTMLDDKDQPVEIAPKQLWVRLHDLFSTQCFAPEEMVPGMGTPRVEDKVTHGGRDESKWRCKPGDLVMVVYSPWDRFEDLSAEMKRQLGRVGVVLGREMGEHGAFDWRWTVANLNGRKWDNEYTVDGEPYTVEEYYMLIDDKRLLPLVATELAQE